MSSDWAVWDVVVVRCDVMSLLCVAWGVASLLPTLPYETLPHMMIMRQCGNSNYYYYRLSPSYGKARTRSSRRDRQTPAPGA